MRWLYFLSTLAFWLAVAAFWAGSRLPGREAPAAPLRGYTLQQVARHDRSGDCWMVIGGKVYDLSGYLPSHPTPLEVVAVWCGKEATAAFATKNRGRPHSPYAVEQLRRYLIGVVGEAADPSQKAE